ncbi:MAG: flagellar hook-associated protein 1, partial [Thermoleophilaceae bacterium]|nr:flagellar hook-associated protein 1 [Thermoleophilaceae bacterium]
MGVSTFMGIETTLRGLLAQQRALDTTSHNITNAGTEGYSRQEAVFAASPAYIQAAAGLQSSGSASLGTGVDVTG